MIALFFCYLVPTSPPEEIVPVDITPTTITLSWKDIFLPERHGIIRGYQVTYKKLERRSKREAEEKTVKFGADVRTAFMFKLDPYTNYSITVAGYTSQGLGVKKHFIIETKQGGKRTHEILLAKLQNQIFTEHEKKTTNAPFRNLFMFLQGSV